MNRDEARQTRLRLLENGYSPIPNRDKATYLSGWPSVEITPELIDEWARRHGRWLATGLRVENGLVAIDVDVDDKEVVDRIADALMDIVPALMDERVPWLERSSGRAKMAWFFRVDEPFGRLHSRRWLRPGETAEEDDTKFVEVFGGASSRQFGCFGPHTVADNGEVLRSYSWTGLSPLDVPLAALPILTKAQCAALVDAAERIMSDAGWVPVARSTAGENASERVYDLTDEMVFECADGVTRTLSELRGVLAGEDALRCSASWLEGPSAKRRDRCLVALTRAGFVSIWESATGVTHLEAGAEPAPTPEVDLDRLAEYLQEMQERRRARLTAGDDYRTALAKALASYAFCPPLSRVVPLWPRSMTDGEPFAAFRLRLMKHGYTEEPRRPGGLGRFMNPCDAWAKSEELRVVEGIQVRPDMPRPVFDEEGARWVNAYRPTVFTPDEVAAGDPEPGFDFLRRLFPEPVERALVTQWVAHKLRYPHVPMYALVAVAHQAFGTGRNTFGDLLGLMLGEAYVREVPFETFAGKTYQSQYNEWQGDSLLVVVSESAEETEGSAWKTKRNTYERLKQIVDPRPGRLVLVNMKGARNVYVRTCASFFIATNHADALPIPANDRRFCVVQNGETQEPAYWHRLRAWMAVKANVAAFAAALRETDLSDFEPFSPPMFEGKMRMADEAKSDLDEAYDIVMKNMPGLAFTVPQVTKAMRSALDAYDLSFQGDLEAVVRRMVRRNAHSIGERDGPCDRLKEGGRKYRLFARSRKIAAELAVAGPDTVRREALKNGDLSGGGNIAIGLFKAGEKDGK